MRNSGRYDQTAESSDTPYRDGQHGSWPEYREVKNDMTVWPPRLPIWHLHWQTSSKWLRDRQVMRSEFWRPSTLSVRIPHMFSRLFNGGSGLLLGDDDHQLMVVSKSTRLPGKREQGGTAIVVNAVWRQSHWYSPYLSFTNTFCVLDEVNAMLDESNVGRFIRHRTFKRDLVYPHYSQSQRLCSWCIYGVTMGKDSAVRLSAWNWRGGWEFCPVNWNS